MRTLPYWWRHQVVVNERGIYRPLPWAALAVTWLAGAVIALSLWWSGPVRDSSGLAAFGIVLLVGLIGYAVVYSRHGPLGQPHLEVHAGQLRINLSAEARMLAVPLPQVRRVIVYGGRARRKYRFVRADGTWIEGRPSWKPDMEAIAIAFLRDKLGAPIHVEDYQTAFADARGDGPADDDETHLPDNPAGGLPRPPH